MHKSVLLIESINGLNIKPDGTYIDCTLGYAGHSGEILKRLETEGFLFAFDQDEEAVKYSYDKLSKIGNNLKYFILILEILKSVLLIKLMVFYLTLEWAVLNLMMLQEDLVFIKMHLLIWEWIRDRS